MPSGFASLDTGFPDLSGYSSTEQKLQAMEDYLVQLLEQLRYTLHNLGVENFNEEGLRRITEPLDVKVSGIYADEWERGKVYYKGNIVRITNTAGGVKYYEWNSDTPSVAGTKPPDGDWASVSAPTVQSVLNVGLSGISLSYDNTQVASDDHNAAYITLNKDGTTIGGGKVFIKDLDASTIKTGTLDAGKITMLDSFTVKTKNELDESEHNCGYIGGVYFDAFERAGMELKSSQGKQVVDIDDARINITANNIENFSGHQSTVVVSPNSIWLYTSSMEAGSPTHKMRGLFIKEDGIYIQDGSTEYNLFDLFTSGG